MISRPPPFASLDGNATNTPAGEHNSIILLPSKCLGDVDLHRTVSKESEKGRDEPRKGRRNRGMDISIAHS